jgi:hypothetical protein
LDYLQALEAAFFLCRIALKQLEIRRIQSSFEAGFAKGRMDER